MANAVRLAELSMPTELARETAAQINSGTAQKSQIVALTALTGAFGTPGNAVVDVGASFVQATLNNNFRVLEDKINAVIAALKA